MRSIQLTSSGSIDNLVERDCTAREPAAHEIRVRIHASSLNYHDLSVVLGKLGPKQNLLPLSDGAGEVEAVGSEVTMFQVGDRVMSCFCPDWLEGGPSRSKMTGDVPGDSVQGYAAEMVTYPAHYFTRMPVNFSFEQAATLPCAALTAWRALFEEATLVPGDSVLVQGSGGVSVFALQFAKMAGCRVIATSSSGEKLEKLQALGADELINYRSCPDWGKRVLELTNGKGVSAIVEVGGADTLEQSMRAVAFGGYIAVVGVLSGREATLPLLMALHKNPVIKGVSVGSRSHQLRMITAIESSALEPVIGQRFELADLSSAFRFMEAQGHFGKICITH